MHRLVSNRHVSTRHVSTRLTAIGFVLGLLCAGQPYAAAEEAEEPKGPPKLASEEEVAEALVQFKIDFKARGIPKDDVVSQRGWAMKKLTTLHHPEVVATLAKVTKHRNKDLRTLALIYLGDQTMHPFLAAKPILAAMKKHKRDKSMLMTGLQSLCLLKYLGAGKEITALLKHKEFAVKKLAITTVGAIKDIRLLKEILRLLGVDVDVTANSSDSSGSDVGSTDGPSKDGPAAPEGGGGTDSGGGSEGDGGGEEGEGGYSWGGVDVFVPQGEDPEAAVRAAQEKSRSAAEAAARGSGASGGGASGGGGSAAPSTPSPVKAPSGGSAPTGSAPGGSGLSGGSGRGSAAPARGSEELIPAILLTLNKLTGVKFSEPGSIKLWVTENSRVLRAKQKRLDQKERAQKDAPKKAERDARKKAEAEKAARTKAAKSRAKAAKSRAKAAKSRAKAAK